MSTIKAPLQPETTRALEALAPCWTASLRPPPRVHVSEWVEEHRELTPRAGSARPGLWSNQQAPYAVGVFEAWQDARIQQIVLPWAAQTAKTEIMLSLMMFAICNDAGNMMLVLPDDNTVAEFVKTRLRPSFEDNGCLAPYIPDKKTALGVNGFTLTNCNLFLAGSNSPAALAVRTPARSESGSRPRA